MVSSPNLSKPLADVFLSSLTEDKWKIICLLTFSKDTAKRYALCGKAFLPGSNRAKYCDDCKSIAQRRQKAEYAKRHRANSRKIEQQSP